MGKKSAFVVRVKAAQFLSNGDSCGICPCWRRPEPWIRCRVGPRSGFRCRAALQQPLVHWRRCIRHGLVRCVYTCCKHVYCCCFSEYCNYVSFVAWICSFNHSAMHQPHFFSRLSWTCCFCLKPVACTFLFLCWTFKHFSPG